MQAISRFLYNDHRPPMSSLIAQTILASGSDITCVVKRVSTRLCKKNSRTATQKVAENNHGGTLKPHGVLFHRSSITQHLVLLQIQAYIFLLIRHISGFVYYPFPQGFSLFMFYSIIA